MLHISSGSWHNGSLEPSSSFEFSPIEFIQEDRELSHRSVFMPSTQVVVEYNERFSYGLEWSLTKGLPERAQEQLW